MKTVESSHSVLSIVFFNKISEDTHLNRWIEITKK